MEADDENSATELVLFELYEKGYEDPDATIQTFAL
jgi:hypothetical protein